MVEPMRRRGKYILASAKVRANNTCYRIMKGKANVPNHRGSYAFACQDRHDVAFAFFFFFKTPCIFFPIARSSSESLDLLKSSHQILTEELIIHVGSRGGSRGS